MPYVLAFNRSAIEDKAARLAAYLGLADASFESLLGWVLELRRRLGIPHVLGELGVSDSDLDRLAAMAEDDPSAGGNPVRFDAAAARAVIEAAMAGRVG
jgi:alcohol dehydrogenase class IV